MHKLICFVCSFVSEGHSFNVSELARRIERHPCGWGLTEALGRLDPWHECNSYSMAQECTCVGSVGSLMSSTEGTPFPNSSKSFPHSFYIFLRESAVVGSVRALSSLT